MEDRILIKLKKHVDSLFTKMIFWDEQPYSCTWKIGIYLLSHEMTIKKVVKPVDSYYEFYYSLKNIEELDHHFVTKYYPVEMEVDEMKESITKTIVGILALENKTPATV